MTWQVVTVANLVVAFAYFAIAYIVFNGLRRSGQLWENKLGTATAFIFLTCGVHHGSHSIHMLLPSLGIDDKAALAMREAWHPPTAVWDVITAGVGLYYLSLRGSYASVLRGAAMFEDLKARERQAVEINDNIVQGLTIARYALDAGANDQTRAAIESTLAQSRQIITELLGEKGSEIELGPGDLRRQAPASPGASPDP